MYPKYIEIHENKSLHDSDFLKNNLFAHGLSSGQRRHDQFKKFAFQVKILFNRWGSKTFRLSPQIVCLLQVLITCITILFRGQHLRYYYDSATDSCNQFSYGGCAGNGNNFLTAEKCEEFCINNITHSQVINSLISFANISLYL